MWSGTRDLDEATTAVSIHDGELAIHDRDLAASHNHIEADAALVLLGGSGGAVDPVHYTVGAGGDPSAKITRENQEALELSSDRGRLNSYQQNILGNIHGTKQGTRVQQILFYEVQSGNTISKLRTLQQSSPGLCQMIIFLCQLSVIVFHSCF